MALPVFSQDGIPARQHLPVQKGKSEIVLSGSYRTRGEIQQGYNIKTYDAEGTETFLLSRLRLDLEFRYANRLEVVAQVQDARVAGSSCNDVDFPGKNNPFHDLFDINNLYFIFKPADSIELIVGRQAVNLGGGRVFGPGNWEIQADTSGMP